MRLALPGVAALLTLALATGCRAPCAAPADDAAAIAAVVRAQEAAWNRGDVEGYMRAGYWDSPELVFLSGGSTTRGFGPVLERYTQRYKSEGAEMGRLEFAELETVRLGDDVALVRGHWQLDFAKQADVGGLFTLVLRKRPEGWRIVHDHTSVDAK